MQVCLAADLSGGLMGAESHVQHDEINSKMTVCNVCMDGEVW